MVGDVFLRGVAFLFVFPVHFRYTQPSAIAVRRSDFENGLAPVLAQSYTGWFPKTLQPEAER